MDYLIFGFVGLLALDMLMDFRDRRKRWREVAGGHAGIFTLRMLTGIPDRLELTHRFGDPDPSFHYGVSEDAVRAARTGAQRVFDRPWIEPALLALAVAGGVHSVVQGGLIVGLSLICAGILYRIVKRGHTIVVLARCYRQMLEEGRVKMALAKSQAG